MERFEFMVWNETYYFIHKIYKKRGEKFEFQSVNFVVGMCVDGVNG